MSIFEIASWAKGYCRGMEGVEVRFLYPQDIRIEVWYQGDIPELVVSVGEQGTKVIQRGEQIHRSQHFDSLSMIAARNRLKIGIDQLRKDLHDAKHFSRVSQESN